jgi:hypothetical protein
MADDRAFDPLPHAEDPDAILDAMLDRALFTYTAEEPDPSLRTRILARVTAPAPSRSRIWWIGAAATCAAALLLAFLLHPANRNLEERAVEVPAMTTAPPPPGAVAAKADRPLTHSAHPRVVATTRHVYRRTTPRRRIFLASAPLTGEETTLLRFAQQHPEQARQVLSPPPSGLVHTEPVVIAPIQIADLSGSQPDSH